jgi:hypothetical protein
MTVNDSFLHFLENCEFCEILEHSDFIESLGFPFQMLVKILLD